MSTLVAGLKAQSRVIHALLLRDIGSRHGGDAAGVLWLLIEPALVTMIVVGIHVFKGATQIQSVPVILFILTGYMPHLLFRHGGVAGVAALKANSGLLYHRQVHYLDLVLSRLLVEIISVLIAFCAIYFGFYLFDQLTMPRLLGYIYLGWFLHIWFIAAACFFFSGLALIWETVRRLFMPISLLMLPAYGAFFMLDWVPENLRYYLLLFPPANASEVLRRGYFGASYSTYFDLPYTIGVNLLLTLIGFVVLHIGRSRMND